MKKRLHVDNLYCIFCGEAFVFFVKKIWSILWNISIFRKTVVMRLYKCFVYWRTWYFIIIWMWWIGRLNQSRIEKLSWRFYLFFYQITELWANLNDVFIYNKFHLNYDIIRSQFITTLGVNPLPIYFNSSLEAKSLQNYWNRLPPPKTYT